MRDYCVWKRIVDGFSESLLFYLLKIYCLLQTNPTTGPTDRIKYRRIPGSKNNPEKNPLPHRLKRIYLFGILFPNGSRKGRKAVKWH